MTDNTVYAVNNQYFARLSIMMSWCVRIGEQGEWTSVVYGRNFNRTQLRELKNIFSSPLYPATLRDALQSAIVREEQYEKQDRLDQMVIEAEWNRIMTEAESEAVSPVEVELRQLKEREQKILTQLAVAHLCKKGVPIQDHASKMALGLLKDNVLELVLIEPIPKMYWDSPVAVKRPKDNHTANLAGLVFPLVD